MKICKSCPTELSSETAYCYEVRNGVQLFRNSCKKCFTDNKKKASGTKPVGEKICPTCEISKSSKYFGKDSHRADGITYECSNCKRSRNYSARLKREYSLNKDDYDSMLESQNNKCACCMKNTKLVVDHNHHSGEVRGLLCDKCNLSLGLVGDSCETLERMIRYVKRN